MVTFAYFLKKKNAIEHFTFNFFVVMMQKFIEIKTLDTMC
jgi:hypothetical protein